MMRFGRVISFFFLLLVLTPVHVHAQDLETVPAEVQGSPVEAAQDHVPGPVHEEGGSMPQLDPTFYASQLFWLVVSGGLMFLLMSKVALPRISAVLEMRDNQVRKDLEKAAKLKLEAEDVKLGYLRALRDADERSRALTERTLNEVREKQSVALSELNIRTQQQIADTEATLRTQKEAVLTEVSNISKTLSETIIGKLSTKAA